MKKKPTRPAKIAKPAAAKVPPSRQDKRSRKSEEAAASSSETKVKGKSAAPAKLAPVSRPSPPATAGPAVPRKTRSPGKSAQLPSTKLAAPAPAPAVRRKALRPGKVAAEPATPVLPKTGTSPKPGPVAKAARKPKVSESVQAGESQSKPGARIRNTVLDKVTAESLKQQLRPGEPPAVPAPVVKGKKPRSLSEPAAKVTAPEVPPRPPVGPPAKRASPPPRSLPPAAAKPVVEPPRIKDTPAAPVSAPKSQDVPREAKPAPAPRMHPVARPKAPVSKSVLRKLRAEPPAKAPPQPALKTRIAKSPALLPQKAPAARRLAARAAAGRRAKPNQPLQTESAEQAPLMAEPPAESMIEAPAQELTFQSVTARAEPPTKPKKIPAYLLEGDEPTPLPEHLRPKAQPPARQAGQPAHAAAAAQPGHAGAKPTVAKALEDVPARTELILTARDPHCLYALWEMDERHLRMWVTDAADSRLVLRVYREHTSRQPITEIHLHSSERHSFCHVPDENTRYIATLGYYRWDRSWQEVARSGEAVTPPKAPSVSRTVEFGRHDVPVTPPAAPEGAPPAEPAATPAPPWVAHPEPPAADKSDNIHTEPGTNAQETWAPQPLQQAAPTVLHPAQPHPEEETSYLDPVRERQMIELLRTFSIVTDPADSLVLARSVEERDFREVVSQAAGLVSEAPAPVSSFSLPLALPSAGEAVPVEVSSVVHAAARAVPGPDFWFKVNAEVVVYGSTVPTARVTIGNRPIRLRPDGTFSFRFSLPDGQHTLPIVATAVHGDERAARLEFTRRTGLSGSVGTHPQDPSLKPPSPDNVS